MFNTQVFLITLILGLIINYFIPRRPETILKYPSPVNLETVYKDKAGQCYKYTSRTISCTNNAKNIDFA